jgi:hypothetical protein
MDSRRLRPWLFAVTLIWLGAVATGLWFVWSFDNASGVAANPPTRWPAESRLAHASDRPTLVLLAHPQCSCTVASLGELAEVLARVPAHPKTYVIFLKPAGFADEWVESDLWHRATRLPDVTVLQDDEGITARQFGAATSGQTFLYDAQGALLFSGGITGARAHAGDNTGRQSLVALLNHDRVAGRPSTNVFGCPLFNSGT